MNSSTSPDPQPGSSSSAGASGGAAFTGRRRRSRKTRRSVLLANRVAGVLITLGGLGTILAVSLVCVFLLWVVVPLFLPSSLAPLSGASAGGGGAPGQVVHAGADEYLRIGWVATADGSLTAYRLDTGEQLSRTELSHEGRSPSAMAFALRDGHVALAFGNLVQLGSIDFQTTFVEAAELPADLRALPAGEIATFGQGILERTAEGQFRLQQLRVELPEPAALKSDAEVALIDVSVSSKGTVFAALTRDGQLHLAQVTQRKNLLTGEVTNRLKSGSVQVELPAAGVPSYLKLAGLGDAVFLAWDDGLLQRFDTRNATRPELVEQVDLVESPGDTLTALAFLIGKTTLVSGDSAGRVRAWFRIKPEEAQTADGALLVAGHELPRMAGPVAFLGASSRSRMVAAASDTGQVRLFHVTSEQEVAEQRVPDAAGAMHALLIAPKDDALLALAGDRLLLWSIDAPHPQTTWASILRPVWYEGYNAPEHVWQSSSGTDDFEEKYGLVPLVFGTLKATFYSMLFGAPLALLAAIYTSEFLHPRAKARVKPTIEIMASLPSVVLGFLAALFFAPLVENIVPQCLALFVTIPFAYLLGAHLWQLLPGRMAAYLGRFRMLGMVVALPAGVGLAWLIGRPVERWLFAGDIKAWLDGQIGNGIGAWMFVLLPLSCLAVAWLITSSVTPAMRRYAGTWQRLPFGLLDLGKLLAGCLLAAGLAYGLGAVLDGLGWDPRGTYVGTYVQRNALVVGFIMGFAVIPIIYTISDDALSAVPESLRAGSLGAGATPWQTAMRVVIPTAMSGLFSAMMVGLGRAVGETMIVLMAAGNTPVLDWNIFNGFRTLSANIAVELPEAVIDSTHYRMLFLAALSLFVMTFFVNTIAEVVRLRFRKRAFQL